MIIPFGFLKQPVSGISLPDFSGLNITQAWTTFKTSEATINYFARISRNGLVTSGNLLYVFYDEWGFVSMDSQVSTTTTANESTTVREWFLSGARTDYFTFANWYEQVSGLSVDFQVGQLANAPFFAQNIRLKTSNLTTATLFRDSANSVLDRSPLTELGTGSDFTVTSVSSAFALGQADVIINTRITNTGTNSRFAHQNRGDNQNATLFRNTSSTNYVGTLLALQNVLTQKELIATVENAVEMKTYFFAALQDTDSITGNFDNETFDLGASSAGNNPFNGYMQAAIVSNSHAVTAADMNTALDGVLAYSTNYNIVADGNSITFGNGATSGQEYPTILGSRLTNTATTNTVTNKGVGGQTTQQMEADAVTDIDPLINVSKRNILLAWEARNDMIQNSLSVSDAYNNMVTYCTNRRAAGWEVIVGTILPTWTATYKGDSTVTGYNLLNTEREAVNVLIRYNWASFADGIVDFALDSDFNTFHNNEQAGYVFSATRPTTSANGLYGDGTHCTDAGYQVISNMFFDEIIKLVHKS